MTDFPVLYTVRADPLQRLLWISNSLLLLCRHWRFWDILSVSSQMRSLKYSNCLEFESNSALQHCIKLKAAGWAGVGPTPVIPIFYSNSQPKWICSNTHFFYSCLNYFFLSKVYAEIENKWLTEGSLEGCILSAEFIFSIRSTLLYIKRQDTKQITLMAKHYNS